MSTLSTDTSARQLELLCIATRTSPEIKALLQEIRDQLATGDSPAQPAGKAIRRFGGDDWFRNGWRAR